MIVLQDHGIIIIAALMFVLSIIKFVTDMNKYVMVMNKYVMVGNKLITKKKTLKFVDVRNGMPIVLGEMMLHVQLMEKLKQLTIQKLQIVEQYIIKNKTILHSIVFLFVIYLIIGDTNER